MREKELVGIGTLNDLSESDCVFHSARLIHVHPCPCRRIVAGIPVRPKACDTMVMMHHFTLKSGIASMAMRFRVTVTVAIFPSIKNRHFNFLIMKSYIVLPP